MLDLTFFSLPRSLCNISHLPDLGQALTCSLAAPESSPGWQRYCPAALPSCSPRSLVVGGAGGLAPDQGQATRDQQHVFHLCGSIGSPTAAADRPALLQSHPPALIRRAQPLSRRAGAAPESCGFSELLSPSPAHQVGEGLQMGRADGDSRSAAQRWHWAGHWELGTPLPRQQPPTSQRRGIAALRGKGNGKVVTQRKSNLAINNNYR